MKAFKLKRGDTIAVVSLSSGILGEEFASHELEIAKKRLAEYGFQIKCMPHALKGLDYVKNHPRERALDLLEAFNDTEVKAVFCAIGGDDTYRIAPFLFENGELEAAVKNHPKIFLGFSDSTVNHLMLHKCGLNTFYGQAVIPDLAELDVEMLPYSKRYFEQLCLDGKISEITSSSMWYEERTSFGREAIGTKRICHTDEKGFEVLRGSGEFSGEILGGCVETISDMLTGDRYPEEKAVIEKYKLFPEQNDWKGKILLLETSEEQVDPESLRHMLEAIKTAGVFDVVLGVIIGKPMDELYYDSYKKVYTEVIDRPDLSIVYNINIGHATPRCILPFGVKAVVDAKENKITILEDILLD